jgi:hypothetical protein
LRSVQNFCADLEAVQSIVEPAASLVQLVLDAVHGVHSTGNYSLWELETAISRITKRQNAALCNGGQDLD